mgnify:CR=1 FL=1|jgi:co-chaperonin GroES (HSP10)
MAAYEPKKVKLKAIHDNVLIADMEFGEQKTSSGIILKSDDGKVHGIKPRWGQVYKVGPEQTDVKVGQWVLVEHGRWTRGLEIDDGEGIKTIRKVDITCMLAVSDEPPSSDEIYIPLVKS